MPAITIRVTPEELVSLQARAAADDRTMQRFVHRLIFTPNAPIAARIEKREASERREETGRAITQLRTTAAHADTNEDQFGAFRPAPKPGKR